MEYDNDLTIIKTMKDYSDLYSLDMEKSNNNQQTILDKKEKALNKALDIRKFEIELYWKRAGYFWSFIAITFTSYFWIITNDNLDVLLKKEVSFMLSGLGLFFSLCWFFVNKGSKYWQENWEKHVDLLEDDIIGPLYKTTIDYDTNKIDRINPLKAYPYSVGKINQILSFSIVLFWLYLFANRIFTIIHYPEHIKYFNYLIVIIGFIFLFYLLLFRSKSSLTNGANFTMKQRIITK